VVVGSATLPDAFDALGGGPRWRLESVRHAAASAAEQRGCPAARRGPCRAAAMLGFAVERRIGGCGDLGCAGVLRVECRRSRPRRRRVEVRSGQFAEKLPGRRSSPTSMDLVAERDERAVPFWGAGSSSRLLSFSGATGLRCSRRVSQGPPRGAAAAPGDGF